MSSNHTHYNYLVHFTPDADVQKYITGVAVAAGLLIIGQTLAKRLQSFEGISNAVIPSERISLFGGFDFLVETFLRFQDSILGKENRKFAPFTLTVFTFVLFSNLLGLVPGIPAATTTVWINVGLALFVFLYFNYLGVKEHGAFGYILHFAGPIAWLAWLIFPLEILSTLLRIMTLNLRLYWNVTADHLVLYILTDIAKIGAVPVYILGTFVSFMQAFVFTTLTMVYILLATQHEHEEENQHGKKSR